MSRAKFLPLAVLLAVVTLSACANTVRGVGADVRSTAEAVEDQVER